MQRAVLASFFLVIVLFITVAGFAVTSFMLDTVHDNMNETAKPMLSSYSQTRFENTLTTLRNGFGWVSVLMVIAIIIIYLVDALRSEPETYWRGPNEP